ncbi:TonB-dependent receptor [Flavicella sp.]|uniref:SusC/RagA family TonB-linked outer membrane protein n=1 Tax=Flavicella sp. TaxID=2957742 RepID=UPI003017BA33
MNKKHLLSIGILCLMSFGVFAQNVIKGKVVEQSSGEGLPGVSIIIKGTSTGTSTDFDGNFELNSTTGENILIFSYIGFKTAEQNATSTKFLSISLIEDAEALDEIIVVGYGTARKKDLTGAVTAVGTKDFNKGAVVSAQTLIQGKVAGVNITSAGGAPGEGQQIRIRGTGSLTLTSNPLIVIDGVPMNDGGIGGSRNVLNSINPADIETMTVLKDASSTAIFGSRAANGVIMITTKKGSLGQDFKVSFNTNFSSSSVLDNVSVLDPNQFRTLINEIGTADQIALLGASNTNWQDEIYQTAFNTESNLSLSGSAGNLPYRVSVGFTDTDGVLKTDNLTRTTAKVSLTPQFFDDHLKIQLNANTSIIKNRFANRGSIESAVGYDPTQAIYDENSKYGGYSTWIDPATDNIYNLAPTNPIALLNLKNDLSDVYRFIGNIKFDYKLHFMPDVTAVLNVGTDNSTSEGHVVTDRRMPTTTIGYNGEKDTYSNESKNSLLDFYLNYKKELNKDHNIGMMLGYSYQKFEFDNFNEQYDYFEDSNENLYNSTVDKSKNVLISFFGRANYNYQDKYLITATLRADASSLLNPDDRWGYFPSVALAWNVTNEEFLNDSDIINNLKVRIGYGQVGNVNGLNPYQYLTRYTASEQGASYQFGDSFSQTYRPEPINEDLRWEIGSTFNAGIDYSLFKGRISGSLDAYIKKTEDLIANSTIDPFTNFGNRIDANIGDMENSGIEFAVNVVPIQNENLRWTLNYNIAFNQNEITRMPDIQDVGGISGGTGNTIQRHEKGQEAFSFFVYEQVYDENNKPIEGVYVDRNNDGKITEEDRYFCNSPNADITMGLSSSVNYKNWDFNISTRASLGNYVYDNVSSFIGYEHLATANNILSNLSTDYLNSGFTTITDTNLRSDYYVKNASFFKIDNITLGYTIPKKITKTLGIRVYGTVQNLLTVSDYDGLDPEIQGGIDNNLYPRPQTFLAGLNVNF